MAAATVLLCCGRAQHGCCSAISVWLSTACIVYQGCRQERAAATVLEMHRHECCCAALCCAVFCCASLQILLFNLPVNFAQGTSIFWAYVIGFHESPLTAIQVLYVNMVTVSERQPTVLLCTTCTNTVLGEVLKTC